MRGSKQLSRHAELLEDGPAAGINAIAADFVPREYALFQDQGPQPGLGAKSGACGSGGPATGDGNVVRTKAEAVPKDRFVLRRR